MSILLLAAMIGCIVIAIKSNWIEQRQIKITGDIENLKSEDTWRGL